MSVIYSRKIILLFAVCLGGGAGASLAESAPANAVVVEVGAANAGGTAISDAAAIDVIAETSPANGLVAILAIAPASTVVVAANKVHSHSRSKPGPHAADQSTPEVMDRILKVEDVMDSERMDQLSSDTHPAVQNYCAILSGAGDPVRYRMIRKSQNCNSKLVSDLTAQFCKKWHEAPFHVVRLDCRVEKGKPVAGGCIQIGRSEPQYCK